MNVKVYQLTDRDDRLFVNYERTVEKYGEPNVEAYHLVYEGEMPDDTDPEKLFHIFNVSKPEGYKGHSLSVSDVIAMETEEGTETWFVDSFGFAPLKDFFRTQFCVQSLLANVHLYIDMDGVLAKWNTCDSIEDTFQQGYFLSREPETEIVKLIFLLNRAGINTRILTAVYQNGYAAKEKKQWLRDLGIHNEVVMVPYGESKHAYVSDDGLNILLDDYSKNLTEWVSDGSKVGVKFFNGINGNYGTWKGYALNVAQGADAMMKTLIGIAMTEKALRTNELHI